MKTITLYRPTGPTEYKLIQKSKYTKFPPRLPEQPIFYPVLTEDYAVKIARDWNVPASGIGYVLQFEVDAEYLDDYRIQRAGGKEHQEYWIPAANLEKFNAAIVGKIKKIHTFQKWFVYLVKCSDSTLYTGITNNLNKRIDTHNQGKGAKYTRTRVPVALIKSFEFNSKSEALKEEYKIKQLSRYEKLKL